jgi:Protein of unknown function DUF262
MLPDEITAAQRLVRTDAYQMSIGEIVSMYDNKEIIIDPEFQRFFRWDNSQKSKLVESLLLGFPLPSIFVFEKENGQWELIDGLQRLSTILEFMGRLRGPDGGLRPPSILEATKYLPSLHNTVWEVSEKIEEATQDDQVPLDKTQQLAIRRARIGVEILKRPSDDQTKFDLFQRLNAGGTQANSQELRNCIMLMINPKFFKIVQLAADRASFRRVINLSEDQIEKQRHMEFAIRFLVHTYVPYDGKLDVEEYIDGGAIQLAKSGKTTAASKVFQQTFDLLDKVAGSDILRRFEDGRHTGKVGLVALEVIAVGVAKNITAIASQRNPEDFIRQKAETFWGRKETSTFTQPGLRGTTRIQRTVPFGEHWFKP